MAGLAFRRRFRGSAFVFYLAIASLIMPGLLVGLGIALSFRLLGLDTNWYTSALGAQLTWTLPFGLLIMFAVLSRFNRAYEEAATDLGATSWQRLREVTLPILLPGIIGVALFGFTLSYDEFARTALAVGRQQHAAARDLGDDHQRHLAGALRVGTVTTAVSFVVIVARARLDRRSSSAGARGAAMSSAIEARRMPWPARRGRARRGHQALRPDVGGRGSRPDHPARLAIAACWARAAAARPRSCA